MFSLLLILQGLSGHVDENLLNAHADSLRVPRPVVWAVAYMETRTGKQGNRPLGPGVIDTLWHHDIMEITRRCREVGRMQLRPCGNFASLLGPRCSPALLRASYNDNVWCGVSYLRFLYDKYHSWEDAIWHYNGSKRYRDLALEYLGSLYLRSQAWDAAIRAPRTCSNSCNSVRAIESQEASRALIQMNFLLKSWTTNSH